MAGFLFEPDPVGVYFLINRLRPLTHALGPHKLWVASCHYKLSVTNTENRTPILHLSFSFGHRCCPQHALWLATHCSSGHSMFVRLVFRLLFNNLWSGRYVGPSTEATTTEEWTGQSELDVFIHIFMRYGQRVYDMARSSVIPQRILFLCVCVCWEEGFVCVCAVGCLSHYNYRKSCSKRQWIHFFSGRRAHSAQTHTHTAVCRRARSSFDASRNLFWALIYQHRSHGSILSARLWWTSTFLHHLLPFLALNAVRNNFRSFSERRRRKEKRKGIIDILNRRLQKFLSCPEFNAIWIHFIIANGERSLSLSSFTIKIKFVSIISRLANDTHASPTEHTYEFILSLRILSFLRCGRGRWDVVASCVNNIFTIKGLCGTHRWWNWINMFMFYLLLLSLRAAVGDDGWVRAFIIYERGTVHAIYAHLTQPPICRANGGSGPSNIIPPRNYCWASKAIDELHLHRDLNGETITLSDCDILIA